MPTLLGFGLEPNQQCVAACTAIGAGVGGAIGTIGGGAIGGAIGGAGGSLALPGGGTIGGGASGVAIGGQIGGTAGAAAGAVAGSAVGQAVCPDDGSKPEGNCKLLGQLAAFGTKGWKRCHWNCKGWSVIRYWPIEIPCPDNIYPAPGWANPPPPRTEGSPTPTPPIEWN